MKKYGNTTEDLAAYEDPARRRGNAEGKAEFILETLTDYGTVPPRIRERILDQTNISQLKRWFFLARQVRSVDEFVNRM